MDLPNLKSKLFKEFEAPPLPAPNVKSVASYLRFSMTISPLPLKIKIWYDIHFSPPEWKLLMENFDFEF